MRLLCDRMLARLARLLRAAGLDTALAADGATDADLLELVRAEGRVLISRDRRLAAQANGLALSSQDPQDQAAEAGDALGLDWLFAPFTRCLVDNMPLRAATPAEIAAMPASAQSRPGPLNACPACGRLYWPGSHVKRLTAKLETLAAARAGRETGPA